jgi:hypothetical protein
MGLRDALHRLHIGIFRWRFRLSFLTRLRRYPLHTIRFPVLLLLACLLAWWLSCNAVLHKIPPFPFFMRLRLHHFRIIGIGRAGLMAMCEGECIGGIPFGFPLILIPTISHLMALSASLVSVIKIRSVAMRSPHTTYRAVGTDVELVSHHAPQMRNTKSRKPCALQHSLIGPPRTITCVHQGKLHGCCDASCNSGKERCTGR